MTNERKQSVLSKALSCKHSKTTSSFLYSVYLKRAGKTSPYMRGVDFTHFNTCCTFKVPDVYTKLENNENNKKQERV